MNPNKEFAADRVSDRNSAGRTSEPCAGRGPTMERATDKPRQPGALQRAVDDAIARGDHELTNRLLDQRLADDGEKIERR
jgi:hypothetical protein